MFNDLAFRDRVRLAGVNSINWARIVAQIAYYFAAAAALGAPHRPVSFCGADRQLRRHLRRLCGAGAWGCRIDRLVIATNANDILRAGAARRASTRCARWSATSSPVHGHPGLLQLRALPVRGGGPRCRRGCAPAWAALRQIRPVRARRQGARPPARRTSTPPAPARPRSRTASAASGARAATCSTRTPPAASSPRPRRLHDRATRRSCSPPPIRPNSPTPSQPITGERPALPPRLASLMTAPERITVLPNDLSAVERFVEDRARGQTRSRGMTHEMTRLAERPARRLPPHAARRDGLARRLGGAGARHEQDAEHGISHLLEHMAFKGTERRSASDIAEEIEAVGGELNAATSLETTAYFARVLKADIGLALDILADILQIPRYAAGRARARARGDPAGDRRHPRQPRRDRLRAAAGCRLPRAGDRPPDPRHHRERQALRRRRPARLP